MCPGIHVDGDDSSEDWSLRKRGRLLSAQSRASVSDALLWLGEVDAAIEVLEGGLEKAAAACEMMGSPVQSPFAAVDPTYVQSYLFALNMLTKTRDQVSNAHWNFERFCAPAWGRFCRARCKTRILHGGSRWDICLAICANTSCLIAWRVCCQREIERCST